MGAFKNHLDITAAISDEIYQAMKNNEYHHPAETISSTKDYEDIYAPGDTCLDCGSLLQTETEINTDINSLEMVTTCMGCGNTYTE